jgi:hypothetical protein
MLQHLAVGNVKVASISTSGGSPPRPWRLALAGLQGVLQAAAELLLLSGSAGTPTCGSSISIIFSSSRGLRQ